MGDLNLYNVRSIRDDLHRLLEAATRDGDRELVCSILVAKNMMQGVLQIIEEREQKEYEDGC